VNTAHDSSNYEQSQPGFAVTARLLPDHTLVVKLTGELDIHTGAIVQEHVRVYAGTCNEIVYELSEVSFIDGAGMRAVLDPEMSRTVRFEHPSSPVRTLQRLLGFEWLSQPTQFDGHEMAGPALDGATRASW
jgi:anti-anti-sigma regulatory factor